MRLGELKVRILSNAMPKKHSCFLPLSTGGQRVKLLKEFGPGRGMMAGDCGWLTEGGTFSS